MLRLFCSDERLQFNHDGFGRNTTGSNCAKRAKTGSRDLFCSERQEAFEAGFSKLVGTQINSILAIMYESFEEKKKLSHVSPFGVAQPL